MDTKDSSLNLPGQKSSPAAKGYGFRYPAIVPQETELRKRSTRMINHSALVCGLAFSGVRPYFLEKCKQSGTRCALWGKRGAPSAVCRKGVSPMPSFLKLFTNNQDTLSLGLRYSNIVLLFSIIIHVEITFEKYFQAMGMMVVSMLSMLCGCILNIILDPVLIFGIGPFPRLGIEGAAIATGIGQCSTLLIYILFYIFKKPPVTIRKHLLRPEKNVCIRLYGVGIPGALNMALPSLLISALNGILASISESGVIILGIYYKLQTFLYLSVNGMIQGMRPLMGYNYGAKEYRRVNKIYRLALTIAIGIMTAGTLLFMFTPETFMKMFTTQETTIAAGASALRIISCGFIVSSVSVVSSGALEALGKGNESLVVSLLRYLVIIVPLAFVLSRFIGANGVWHSFWITETVTAFVAYGIYRKALRNK